MLPFTLTSSANHSLNPLGVLNLLNKIPGVVLMRYSNSIFSLFFIILRVVKVISGWQYSRFSHKKKYCMLKVLCVCFLLKVRQSQYKGVGDFDDFIDIEMGDQV